MKHNLIGLAGLKRSGKDTVANFLKEIGYIQYSFAQPIKEAVSVMTGYSYEYLDNQDTKEKPLEEFCHDGINITPRLMMQTLGTEWARELIHPDFWLIIAKKRIENAKQNIVISDVRFENEAEFIRNYGGVVVHIQRPSMVSNEFSNHASENGVEIHAMDKLIINDGSLNDLREKSMKILPF
jgi:dephospho-CoA kinase